MDHAIMVCVEGEASSETPNVQERLPGRRGLWSSKAPDGEQQHAEGTHKDKSKPWASPSHPEQVPSIQFCTIRSSHLCASSNSSPDT